MLFEELFQSELFQSEWLWAMIAVIVALIVFIVEQKTQNKISRADFVYNISNDFANNEKILKVYQWLENCRRKNYTVNSCKDIDFCGEFSAFECENNTAPIDFIDIDTYINHFEAVYIILESVKINNIDELFQQRFFTFMMNPFIQKEELFECFYSDKNDFSLYKKWLTSIFKRKKFNCEELIKYLRKYTCGNFEFNIDENHFAGMGKIKKLAEKRKIVHYLLNYVYYICDPKCQYGFFRFKKSDGELKTLRIIKPSADDCMDIINLQNRVCNSMSDKSWYYKSTEADIEAAVSNQNDYCCLQIIDNNTVVAFSFIILHPDKEHNLFLDLSENNNAVYCDDSCIFETVFVENGYRGYGIQSLMIDILCDWAYKKGKRKICATVHPDNIFSKNNFIKNGFTKVTDEPIEKYDGKRNYYVRELSKPKKNKENYNIYPIV